MFFLQLATQLENVISKECLTCEETFIVKFNKDVCLAICQLSNKALNKFATLY